MQFPEIAIGVANRLQRRKSPITCGGHNLKGHKMYGKGRRLPHQQPQLQRRIGGTQILQKGQILGSRPQRTNLKLLKLKLMIMS